MDNEPKTLSLRCDDHPTLVYTDGSYEHSDGQENAMIGLFATTNHVRFLETTCRKSYWTSDDAGKEHLIRQIELHAIVAARLLRKHVLRDRKNDNWAVLDCYSPGTSKEPTWRDLLVKIEEIDFNHPCYVWATRIPNRTLQILRAVDHSLL